MRAGAWVADLADLLLPAGCIACGTWMPEGRGRELVCGGCRTRLRPASWPRCPRCHHPTGSGRVPSQACRECRDWPAELTRARYAYLLQPPADALVHALKYEGWRELAGEMAGPMDRALALPPARHEGRIVVPVPTTRARLEKRGYNQAELLARALAGRLQLPLVRALHRIRGGATQVALPPSERRANVKGAFALDGPSAGRLQGAHVVLVDDVLTTGATASSAAVELAGGGASEVTVLAFARALPFRRRRLA